MPKEGFFLRFRLFCLCLVFVLGGCGAGSEATSGDPIRAHYAALPELTLSAQIRTDFGDRIIDFAVQYTHRLEGEGEMEVLSPEMIRGVKAKVLEGEVALSYDGVEVALGPLPGTGLSPMESLPLMVWDWSRGYLVAQGRERRDGQEVWVRTNRSAREGVSYETTTVFEKDTLLPISGEVYIDGVCAVTVIFGESEKIS